MAETTHAITLDDILGEIERKEIDQMRLKAELYDIEQALAVLRAMAEAAKALQDRRPLGV